MYKNHNYDMFCIISELLPFLILKICPEHNINTIRDINLQPFSNKHLFGEHPIRFYQFSCLLLAAFKNFFKQHLLKHLVEFHQTSQR